MASKTITIKDEAYQVLKALKLKDESFSDTILRLSKLFSNLKESWGKGTKDNVEYEQELAEIDKRRESFFEGRM